MGGIPAPESRPIIGLVTLTQYVQLCAQRYSLNGLNLKGRGHAARVELPGHNFLFRLLPYVKMTERDAYGDYRTMRVTCPLILSQFRDDLLAAGIDLYSGEMFDEHLFHAALLVYRLTGEVYSRETAYSLARRAEIQRERHADRNLARFLREGGL